jgi:hypothetical protein
MKEIEVSGFDNLSNLGRDLKRVEETYIKMVSRELAQARNSVVGALPGFKISRMNFGRLLRAYREHFKADHGWMEASKIIAGALECDERTVYRIIEDYERASQLPSITLAAMAEQSIDPAAAKNAGVVEDLLRMPEPETREEAVTIVATAHQGHILRKKQQARKVATKPAEMSLEEFAAGIVKQFEDRYQLGSQHQRDAEVQYILELVVSMLGSHTRKLGQYDRPALVPKPALKAAA